jgi:hypothetical protein
MTIDNDNDKPLQTVQQMIVKKSKFIQVFQGDDFPYPHTSPQLMRKLRLVWFANRHPGKNKIGKYLMDNASSWRVVGKADVPPVIAPA